MRNYQRVQRALQVFLLVMPVATLVKLYYLVITNEFSSNHLILIGIFCLPLIIGAIIALDLLTDKLN